jgi:hypothetical protein
MPSCCLTRVLFGQNLRLPEINVVYLIDSIHGVF